MDDESDEPRPPKREQLSKVPSWIMLGFALGIGCMLVWPRSEPPRPALLVTATGGSRPASEPSRPPTVERGMFFEGVFTEWAKWAVWDNELTEVGFWNSDAKAFSDKFEIFRSGDRYYFRSIQQYTRPVLIHGGIPKNSPLEFTEPQALKDQWLKENATENFRKFTGAPEAKKP